MLARKASNIGSSQEDQELSSSGRLGTEPQDFAPRSLVPVRSSSASSPAIIGIIMGLVTQQVDIISQRVPLSPSIRNTQKKA